MQTVCWICLYKNAIPCYVDVYRDHMLLRYPQTNDSLNWNHSNQMNMNCTRTHLWNWNAILISRTSNFVVTVFALQLHNAPRWLHRNLNFMHIISSHYSSIIILYVCEIFQWRLLSIVHWSQDWLVEPVWKLNWICQKGSTGWSLGVHLHNKCHIDIWYTVFLNRKPTPTQALLKQEMKSHVDRMLHGNQN